MLSVSGLLLEVAQQSVRAERAVEPQSSRERPAALRQREALKVEMQVRTTAVRCASRVGKQDSLDRDDAQQV
jgi:hypothetical protein